jgi:hypothetical protein
MEVLLTIGEVRRRSATPYPVFICYINFCFVLVLNVSSPECLVQNWSTVERDIFLLKMV